MIGPFCASNGGLERNHKHKLIMSWMFGREFIIRHLCRAMLDPESQLSSKITEKGILQLLFDLRFLQDVLSGGRPVQSGDESAPEWQQAKEKTQMEISEQQRGFDALEMNLQARSPLRVKRHDFYSLLQALGQIRTSS